MTKNYFDDGREALAIAKKAHCDLRNCSGDHVVVTFPNGKKEPVPNRKIGRGLGYKIWKAFKLAGLVCIAGGIIYILIAYPEIIKLVESTL